MTPPSPTTPLPSGYELLSPDFLREHGAVEGMKHRYTNNIKDDEWDDWGMESTPSEEALRAFVFIAPLGTTAMLSTPLPEVRCDCGASDKISWEPKDCQPTCPKNPRNRLVRVLPQLLAGLKEKPEEVWWADMHNPRWELMNDVAWRNVMVNKLNCDGVAYAIKQHELDAIEAGKEKAPLPATGYANEEEIRRLAQIPQGVSLWDGVRNLAEQNERLKGRIRELNNDDGNAAPVTAAPEKSDPSQVSGPTDGGKWQPIETAPKDGTEILLFSHGDQGVCYWSTCMSHGPGWTWGAGNYFRHPTHWMPLPPPPTAAMKDQTK